MRRKLATFLILFGPAVSLPTRALAQTPNPPWDAWYGPWFMGGGWSSWWWMCPLMMLLMILAMMFFCRFMGCGWRRD